MALATKFRKQGIPLKQRSSASQAAVTATAAAVVTTGASTSAYGFTEAQANALIAQGNANRVDIAALIVLVNQLRSDLVARGDIKGS